MNWKPIETAPKDGTEVLSFPHYVVTYWGLTGLGKAWVGEWSDLHNSLQPLDWEPTHWMPLPDPPEVE